MGKITVTEKILLEGVDINEWAEHASGSESRSYVNFNSTNKHMYISKSGYQQKYVTAYDSLLCSSISDMSSKGYQYTHSKYLGKLGGNHIWLSEKGCRPKLKGANQTSYTTAGRYVLEYDSSNARIKITKPDSSITYVNATVIHMLVTGAGGGGHGGYYWTNYIIVSESQEAGVGANGGTGAKCFVTVDMSKIKKIVVNLGAGGSGSTGRNNASAGGSSSILFNDNSATSISISGGAAGNRFMYNDQNFWTFDWSMKDWHSDSNPGGAGGSKPSFGNLDGVYNFTAFEGDTRCTSTSLSVSDKYDKRSGNTKTVLLSSCCVGGAGAYSPDKPSFGVGWRENTTTGGNGKNGGLFIWY